MTMAVSFNLAHAQSAVPCNVCEDETPGEYYCIECKHTLCLQCELFHRKFTKGHNVVLRTQIGDIDTTVLTCGYHADQASFHCEKCDEPVCGKCITGEHKGHELTDITCIFEKKQESLQIIIKRMQLDLTYLRQQRDEFVTEKARYENTLDKIRNNMEDEKQKLFKELGKIHDKRLNELANIRESNLSTFDESISEMKKKIETFEQKIAEYQHVIEQKSLPAIIDLIKRNERIPERGSKPVLPKLPRLSSWDMQTAAEHLGKLQVASPISTLSQLTRFTPAIISRFTSPLKGWPIICSTKEGNIWLGGYESRELVMVNIKGQVLRQRKMGKRPAALAVLNCGDIIVSSNLQDSSIVCRLLSDDREEPVYDAAKSSYSTGVAITVDQKILVCTGSGRVVKVNVDGTTVQEIYKGSGEYTATHAIEDMDGNIYISDRKQSAVFLTTKAGKTLSKTTQAEGGQKLKSPFGMVVDKMGNILIADLNRNVVYIKDDQTQRMTELMGQSYNIKKPRWLAVDKENNLWITQSDGTILVVKYTALV